MEKISAGLFLIICYLNLAKIVYGVGDDDLEMDKRQFKAVVTPSHYYDTVDGKSTKIPIKWEVKALCKDCLIHEYEAETNGAGEFDIQLAQPFEGFEKIEGVEFTIESKESLLGHKRSYSWYILPNFDRIQHFHFGHFFPSTDSKNKGRLYLRIKFAGALKELEENADKKRFAKYVAQLTVPGHPAAKYSEKELTDAEWKGEAPFDMELVPNVMKEYWSKNKDPSLDFHVFKIPICSICGRQTSQCEDTNNSKIYKLIIYKNKIPELKIGDFMHSYCHYGTVYPERHSHRQNDPCKGCIAKREKNLKTHFRKSDKQYDSIEKKEFFHAHLKMPILQNGDVPGFTYEFVPANPAEGPQQNYNHVELMALPAIPPSDKAGPSGSKPEAESSGHPPPPPPPAYNIYNTGHDEYDWGVRQLHEDWGRK